MTPTLLLEAGIEPAFTYLRNKFQIADTIAARRQVLCIGLQESRLQHRRQVAADGTETGPASSFWQFESGRMSGCNELLVNPRLMHITKQACADFNVEPTRTGIWQAIQFNDVFAAICARLLLYMLPDALPTTADEGWNQYLRSWHPGQPHPATWSTYWSAADLIVKENP